MAYSASYIGSALFDSTIYLNRLSCELILEVNMPGSHEHRSDSTNLYNIVSPREESAWSSQPIPLVPDSRSENDMNGKEISNRFFNTAVSCNIRAYSASIRRDMPQIRWVVAQDFQSLGFHHWMLCSTREA